VSDHTAAVAPLATHAATVHVRIAENIAATQRLLRGPIPLQVAGLADLIVEALRAGNKLLLFGNGGSAADAGHLAAEFVGRFRYDRAPLPALALTDNAAATSAIGNDYGFEYTFARQVEGFGQSGDVAIGLTTSGCSPNVVLGLSAARAIGLHTVALSGYSTPALESCAEVLICTPAPETARVQECQMLLGHIVCELVERTMFPVTR
jgi:D-sedoheptulose 7-phosphate isomerase